MKMSYKIALIAAVALFAIAILLFTGPSDTDEATDTTTVAEQPLPEPPSRKTLMDNPSKDATSATQAKNSSTPPNGAGAPGNSLTNDVRDRIRAIAAAQEADAENTGPAAKPTTPGNTTPVNATALTNTGTGSPVPTTANTPETKPAAPVSRNTLEAILGTSPGTTKAPATDAASSSNTMKPGPEAKPAPGADTMYTVQPGDTFSSIANKHYKDETRWFDIAQANPSVDPARLRVGQELRLPAIQFLAKHEEPVPPGPTGVKTYTIRPGDSLSTVAEKFYDDPTLWRVIYNYNHKVIGDNPNAIQAGMTLRVPPRVQGAN